MNDSYIETQAEEEDKQKRQKRNDFKGLRDCEKSNFLL